MDKLICIYKITNTVTGDFYIGQTRDLDRRIRCHKNNPPSNMKEDVKEYGRNAFKFEILEECFVKDLARLEEHFIKTLNPPYNIRHSRQDMTEVCGKISQSKKGIKFSLEHRKNIQKRMREQAVDLFGKAVICLETQEIFHSIVEAANKKNTAFKGISNVLHGRAITSGGFHWKYADENLNDNVRDENDRHDNRQAVICVETGEIFSSMTDVAKHFGIFATGIRDVLTGIKVTTGGYHWKYADGRPDKTRERKQQKIYTKSVICVETGKIFPSITNAANELGIHRTGISRALRNTLRTSGGYHWKYAD